MDTQESEELLQRMDEDLRVSRRRQERFWKVAGLCLAFGVAGFFVGKYGFGRGLLGLAVMVAVPLTFYGLIVALERSQALRVVGGFAAALIVGALGVVLFPRADTWFIRIGSVVCLLLSLIMLWRLIGFRIKHGRFPDAWDD